MDVSVSEEDDKAIKEILAEFKPSGDRYPPLTMKVRQSLKNTPALVT